MGIEDTRRAINRMVRDRGDAVRRLWTVVGGFDPGVSPDRALAGLRYNTKVMRSDLQGEIQSLVRDIENILKNPPIP